MHNGGYVFCFNKTYVIPMTVVLFFKCHACISVYFAGNGGEIQWCFSQVKGTAEEDVTEGECSEMDLEGVSLLDNIYSLTSVIMLRSCVSIDSSPTISICNLRLLYD